MKRIYLDYAATTPVEPAVLRAIKSYFSEKFGNPSSLHSFGQAAVRALDLARETAGQTIGADFREIIFTSSATEANNLALRGIVKGIKNQELGIRNKRKKKNFLIHNSKFIIPRIIISSIEHESVLETAKHLEQEGVEVIYLPVDKRGVVNLERLKSSLNENTVLVSVMYANNVIGTIQPIAEISNIVRNFRNQNTKYKIQNTIYPLFHTDAVQAFQYLDCDVEKLGVDLMTLSSHKIYGPKGAGLLFVRATSHWGMGSRGRLNPSGYTLNPITTGGGQEFNLRSGTENVPAIIGFTEALKLAAMNRKTEPKKTLALKKYFWRKLKWSIPEAETLPEKSADDKNFLPNILNVSFPGHEAKQLVHQLDVKGVAVGTGSACSIRSATASYVLQEIGISEKIAKTSIRFSLGRPTTKKDIDFSVKIIKNVIK